MSVSCYRTQGFHIQSIIYIAAKKIYLHHDFLISLLSFINTFLIKVLTELSSIPGPFSLFYSIPWFRLNIMVYSQVFIPSA